MSSRAAWLIVIAVIIAGGLLPLGLPSRVAAGPAPGSPEWIVAQPGNGAALRQETQDRYIVTFRDDIYVLADVAATSFENAGLGIDITHVYTAALTGFAATIPASSIDDVLADPRVASVQPDRWLYPTGQTIPTGIRRVGGLANDLARIDGIDTRIDADIAIIDTGVASLADLNIVDRHNCTTDSTSADRSGHGTHTAGIAAAIDNGTGIVGVAPGARIWNVKAMTATGGSWSWVICAIDYVTRNAGQIEVANMSLGEVYGADRTCISSALHNAICKSVAAGVTYVVSAGNNNGSASLGVPAQYDEVLAISAIVDTDGRPGGSGPASWAGPDDALASFSDDGPAVDLAAPGVDTESLSLTGGVAYGSGTSFSSPHVAGASALASAAGVRGPAAIRSSLLASRETGRIRNDTDGYDEGVLKIGANLYGLTFDVTSGAADDPVTATLRGFKPNSRVSITMRSLRVATVTTDGRGDATVRFTVPALPRGAVTAVASDGSGRSTAAFTVMPKARPAVALASPGDRLTVSLRGFAMRETLTLEWKHTATNVVTVATVTTTAAGSASARFTVPATTAGVHTVSVRGSRGSVASTTVTIQPRVALSPGAPVPGSTTQVTLVGFAASEAVAISWVGADVTRPLASVAVSALGSVTLPVTIPADLAPASGQLVATGAGGATAARAVSLTVPTATPTPTPTVTPTATPTLVPTLTPTVTHPATAEPPTATTTPPPPTVTPPIDGSPVP
jgi:subtilisin